jgi:hypothetical protein
MIYIHHTPQHGAADRLGALVAAASADATAASVEAAAVLRDNGVSK